MIIKGTPRIRGMLDLPTIKKQLGKNDSLPVSDVEYWSSDVQIAIKMGYLTAEGAVERYPGPDGEVERVIKLVNKNNKAPLNLPNQNHSIPPGAEFTLKESEIQNSDIRSAISKGLIEVVNAVEENTADEGFVRLGGAPKVTAKTAPKEVAAPVYDAQLDNLTPAQRALFDAVQKNQPKKETPQPDLDINEELVGPVRIVEPANVIDVENPPPITSDDIPDALGKSVIFNPTGDQPVRLMKNATVSGPKREVLTFVDKLQESERIQQHPTLKPQQTDDGLELLDLENIGTKRNPNLPAQKPNSGVELIE